MNSESKSYVIGLDLGTSSCKAAVFDLSGRPHAVSRVAYATATERGGVTQRADEWAEAAIAALCAIAPAVGDGDLLGIGLSGQIGTHVLLDSAGGPLHDAVTWQDGRSAGVVQEVEDAIDRDWLSTQLDTRLPAGAAWPLVRMLWLSRLDPQLFRRARWIAQPKDFLLRRLTGEIASDPSSWRGIARPDGSIVTEALEKLGIANLVPPLFRETATVGGLLPAIAARTGLPTGLSVYIGMNDLNCSLLGIGAVEPGRAFDVAGTSEHLGYVSTLASASTSVNSVPLHGTDTSLYSVYGVSSNGGSIAQWAAAALSGTPGSELGEDALASLVSASAPGSDGLLFLPYLRGERAPVWDAAATGALVGLTQTHGAPEIARAALEGVAFNLRQIKELLPESSPSEIRATGGPTRMSAWNQIKADVLQRPIRLLAEADSAALGAAMVAAIGCGAFPSSAAASAAMVRTVGIIDPDVRTAELYDDAYTRFREVYPALSGLRNPALTPKKGHHV
ncbi:MAG: hypothetical protein JWP85_557 [Rhodoglobus sp.]|nr:hypothetical protein [Rhodoglobus sp.]